MRLLLLNKHKKFENDAIARFCSSVDNSKKWKKKPPTETGLITRLTKSISRSIITSLQGMFPIDIDFGMIITLHSRVLHFTFQF